MLKGGDSQQPHHGLDLEFSPADNRPQAVTALARSQSQIRSLHLSFICVGAMRQPVSLYLQALVRYLPHVFHRVHIPSS